MNNTSEQAKAYKDAKRRVERKMGFFSHLAVYVVVNTGLITLNLLTNPDQLWAVWPLFGWGIGLFFHGLGTFLHAPGARWKERMIEQELKKTPGQDRQQ